MTWLVPVHPTLAARLVEWKLVWIPRPRGKLRPNPSGSCLLRGEATCAHATRLERASAPSVSSSVGCRPESWTVQPGERPGSGTSADRTAGRFPGVLGLWAPAREYQVISQVQKRARMRW